MWTLMVLVVMAAQVATVAIVAQHLRQRKLRLTITDLVNSAKAMKGEEVWEIIEALIDELEKRSRFGQWLLERERGKR